MPRVSDKRERLVAAARVLIHQRGSDRQRWPKSPEPPAYPSETSAIYFKTKDDLGAAVIEGRAKERRQQFNHWDATIGEPRRRLYAFVDTVEARRDQLLADA